MPVWTLNPCVSERELSIKPETPIEEKCPLAKSSKVNLSLENNSPEKSTVHTCMSAQKCAHIHRGMFQQCYTEDTREVKPGVCLK